MSGLKRCPFCGQDPFGLTITMQEGDYEVDGEIIRTWYVVCVGCRGRGPVEDTRKEAIVAWNAKRRK